LIAAARAGGAPKPRQQGLWVLGWAAIALIVALTLVGATAGAAFAADPGVWIKTSQLTKPAWYRQGLASNPATGDVFFSGAFAGLYRTRNGREIGSNTNPIPADVSGRELYNHIGDIAFDAAEGGRLLLPLESYQPFLPDQNPSKTGSIGVMNAKTLTWKYYVKLDPGEIQKAQWVATDPQGLVWTISGHDLLAYSLADLNAANAAPAAAPIHSVRRLANAAPVGAGGAVIYGGRIYLSTQSDGVDRVVSVDTTTGASRVEIEQPGTAEPEGLDAGAYLNGLLHWELVPGGGLSNTQLLNFVPRGARLQLKLNHSRVRAGRKATLTATVRVLTGRLAIPLQGARVRLAGTSAKTNASGRAKLSVTLKRGTYRARASYKGLRTGSRTVRTYRAARVQRAQGFLAAASITCFSLRTTFSGPKLASTCA
jgi:hypothetical protein